MAQEKDDKKKDKSVDPLLIEIQEDMKRERWENFFKKYGSFLAVIAVILLVVFGGNEFYQHQKLQRQKASGEILYSVVGGQSIENPIEYLEGVNGGKGFEQLSKIIKAKVLLDQGELDEAVKEFDSVAADNLNELAIRHIAALNSATIIFNSNPNDDEVEQRLGYLINNNGPFQFHAKELLGIYQLQNNNTEKAKQIFAELVSNPQTPTVISTRIKETYPTYEN